MLPLRESPSSRSRAMTIHLPPNEILFALLLATILMFVAAGVDLPPEDEPRD
jgi:hypothetical protein